ncbi:hypothetical protein HanLR1_Chr16g0629681 [Helianthus annuus]|nr:hypothetical protein HanLR1_Chr16g0629681 [Helianthus annuus]
MHFCAHYAQVYYQAKVAATIAYLPMTMLYWVLFLIFLLQMLRSSSGFLTTDAEIVLTASGQLQTTRVRHRGM